MQCCDEQVEIDHERVKIELGVAYNMLVYDETFLQNVANICDLTKEHEMYVLAEELERVAISFDRRGSE